MGKTIILSVVLTFIFAFSALPANVAVRVRVGTATMAIKKLGTPVKSNFL